jgi:hypothetical protein
LGNELSKQFLNKFQMGSWRCLVDERYIFAYSQLIIDPTHVIFASMYQTGRNFVVKFQVE